MDDSSLCRLIREALSDGNRAAALALAIDQIPEIKAYLGKGWLPYYSQALPVTMRDVERNITRFPEMYKLDLEAVDCQKPSDAATTTKCFVSWVMLIFKRDCQDVRRSRKNGPQEVSTSQPLAAEKGATTIEETIPDDRTVTGVEYLLEQERGYIAKALKRYVEEDPESKLRNCYVRDRPDINCQVLVQKRFLQNPPLTLQEIAKELKTKLPTVQSRFERNCLPLLRDIATKLGYE